MPTGKLQIVRKTVAAMLIASIRQQGDYGDCGASLEKLRQQAREQICGAAFCLYTDKASPGDVEVECCFPVKQAVETDEIASRLLEGGDVLSAIHHGPYRTLGESWEALFDTIERNNIRVRGPRREIYLDDEEAGSEHHVVELQVPIERRPDRS